MCKLNGLPRRDYNPRKHADPCPWGTVVNLYIFHLRKWVKIGEYCEKCGAIKIFEVFKQGLGDWDFYHSGDTRNANRS